METNWGNAKEVCWKGKVVPYGRHCLAAGVECEASLLFTVQYAVRRIGVLGNSACHNAIDMKWQHENKMASQNGLGTYENFQII